MSPSGSSTVARGAARVRLEGRRLPLAEAAGGLALLGVVAAGAAIAAGAAGSRSPFLVPASREGFPGWMSGPLGWLGAGLSADDFGVLLLVMLACYLVALACAEAVPLRWAIAAIVALHGILLLGPPLLSSDVFGYLMYARLDLLEGINPYEEGGSPASLDPASRYFLWSEGLATPYGPLFTIATYALVPLGVPGGMWALKVAVVLAGLACVWLTVSCARRLDRSPTEAAMFVGLNPVFLVYGVGGAHNDLLIAAVALGGLYLAVTARERLAGGMLTAAAAMKAPAGAALPFMLVASRRRWEVVVAALVALAGVALAALVAFGESGLFGFLERIREQEDLVATHSVPNELGLLLGLGGLTDGIRAVTIAAFVSAVTFLLVRTWRGADWIASAGWATLALLVTTAWLLPWYVVWLLPFAAVGGDRRLRIAALALTVFVAAMRVPFIDETLHP